MRMSRIDGGKSWRVLCFRQTWWSTEDEVIGVVWRIGWDLGNCGRFDQQWGEFKRRCEEQRIGKSLIACIDFGDFMNWSWHRKPILFFRRKKMDRVWTDYTLQFLKVTCKVVCSFQWIWKQEAAMNCQNICKSSHFHEKSHLSYAQMVMLNPPIRGIFLFI